MDVRSMELCDLGRALCWATAIAARRCCGEDSGLLVYWIGGLVGSLAVD